MTQKEMVLKHLEDFGCITSWDAIIEYGITSPTKRISELRADGVKIDYITCHKKNRYGKKVTFNVYFVEDYHQCSNCGRFRYMLDDVCKFCGAFMIGISGEQIARSAAQRFSGGEA